MQVSINTIKPLPRNYLAPGQELRISNACEFFAQQLFTKRIANELYIDILVKKTNGRLHGCCHTDDDNADPRFFTITIYVDKNFKYVGNAFIDNILRTLSHEMIHVQQFVRKELVEEITKTGSKVFWNGKVWKPKKNEDAHYDAPWEIDAYGREPGLYLKLLNSKTGDNTQCKKLRKCLSPS